jgi:solute carrier family 25 S-adenosylmethionine transporter 26
MVRVPTEVIKTRMQTSTYGAQGASSLQAARLVMSSSGIKGFYRGFGITVMREVRLVYFVLLLKSILTIHPL